MPPIRFSFRQFGAADWRVGYGHSSSSNGYVATTAGGVKYGWASIDSIAVDGSSYHINGYAYEDLGVAINAGAGAIPEPSALALLACGAAGLYAIRKKRQLAQEQ